RRKPALRFYDTGGNAEGVLRAYGQALADEAGMIVGPLMRGGVDALFALPDPGLPVVALNRGQLPPPTGSTSFTLSPEEEGAAAADRLLDRGLRRVLVVTQADENANRALAAFRERLASRGGEITGVVTVSEENPDYVPALQSAQAGGLRPDAMFLTLKAPQARLLSSQLDNAGLVGVPRLASSLILSGGNLRLDVELDGIEYPELPWLIGLRADLPDPDALGRQLPSAQGGGARLFAFGLDAWQLAAWLDHLQRDPGARVRGATGELSLDAQGNVQRRPAWAVFSGGRARPAPDGALLSDGFPGRAYWADAVPRPAGRGRGGRGCRPRPPAGRRPAPARPQPPLQGRRTRPGDARRRVHRLRRSTPAQCRRLGRRLRLGGPAQAPQAGAGGAVLVARTSRPGRTALPLRRGVAAFGERHTVSGVGTRRLHADGSLTRKPDSAGCRRRRPQPDHPPPDGACVTPPPARSRTAPARMPAP